MKNEGLAIKIGQRLRALRKSAKYTQRQLAEVVGIPQNNICKYERGEVIPSIGILIKLARAYHVSLDAICGTYGYETDEIRTLRRENVTLKKKLLRVREMNMEVNEAIREVIFPDPLMEE